jgi:hypothetical protein
MNLFQNINIPVKPFLTYPVFEVVNPNKNQHWLVDSNFLITDFIEYLKAKGITVGDSNVLFYTPPFGHLGIHIDGDRLHTKSMLNYAWGSDDHSMIWYSLNDTDGLNSKAFTNRDQYISVLENAVTKLAECSVSFPTLVKVGVPHSVTNRSSTGRWCLSIDIQEGNGPGIDFDRGVKLLKE